MSYSVAESILSAHRGACFVKADLHIHTPASHDWDDKNPEPENHSLKVKPTDIVDRALQNDLGIIAITDHNSVEWCEPIIRAAVGGPLTVLPGFELTVRPGIHVLALFTPDRTIDELRDLLISLGITRDQFGEPEAMTRASLEDADSHFKVIRELENAGALVIPAHIHSASGVIGRLKGGQAAKDVLNGAGCRILEVGDTLPDVVAEMLRGDLRRFSLLRNSDAHRLDQIGTRATWIKMDTPSLLGISHVAFEPLGRVQYSADSCRAKPMIVGMTSNGGILRDQVLAFNEDLNCIIGGRGAGKSVVIDYLRFIFGHEPVDPDIGEKYNKRLVDLVGDTTTVWVLVSDSERKQWLYQRTLRYNVTKKGSKTTYQLTAPPAEVYQVLHDERRLVRIGDEEALIRVEFYGQGEVQSITDTAEPARQLKLVDDFARANLEQRERVAAELVTTLKGLEQQIVDNDHELSELDAEIGTHGPIVERIAEIEGDMKDSQLEEHQVWDDANSWVERALQHVKSESAKVTTIKLEPLNKQAFTIPQPEAQTAFDELSTGITEALALVASTEARVKEDLTGQNKRIAELAKEWETQFQLEDARYTEALRKQGVENLAALNRELAEKRNQRDTIQQVSMPRRDALKATQDELRRQRQINLTKLREKWDEIRECRQFAAKEMTRRLSGDVIIRIADERNLNAFHNAVAGLPVSNVRSDQYQKIVETLNPSEFAALVRARDAATLAQRSGITMNCAEKMVAVPEKDLMRIERLRCDDIATVLLVLEQREKALSDLSEGEKCTAILSVILLDEASPLVIDQPEDELDHAFIMSDVVDTLGRVKQKNHPYDTKFAPCAGRQFIVATHNQNIPVLGDAEMVVKMRKVPGERRCQAESAHGLEHPDSIGHILSLEGGREAFERRRLKYGRSGQPEPGAGVNSKKQRAESI